MFYRLVQKLKIDHPLPLHRFVFDPSHSYLKKIIAQRQKTSQKRTMKKNVVKRRPAGTKCKGSKWIADHWKVRRTLNMPVPLPEIDQGILKISHDNGMCRREQDLYQLCIEAPQAMDTTVQPSLELKHSAPRVVRVRSETAKTRKRHPGATSCLLPSSKLLLMPPLVEEARFMTGAEALSLQGIDKFHCVSHSHVSDQTFMSLAGNAFSGGSYALVFIAAIASLKLSANLLATEEDSI